MSGRVNAPGMNPASPVNAYAGTTSPGPNAQDRTPSSTLAPIASMQGTPVSGTRRNRVASPTMPLASLASGEQHLPSLDLLVESGHIPRGLVPSGRASLPLHQATRQGAQKHGLGSEGDRSDATGKRRKPDSQGAAPASWNQPLASTREANFRYAGEFPGTGLVVELTRLLRAETDSTTPAITAESIVGRWAANQAVAPPRSACDRLIQRVKALNVELAKPDVTNAEVIRSLSATGATTDLQVYALKGELGDRDSSHLKSILGQFGVDITRSRKTAIGSILESRSTPDDSITLSALFDRIRNDDKSGAASLLKRSCINTTYPVWSRTFKSKFEPIDPSKEISHDLRKSILAEGSPVSLGFLIKHDISERRAESVIEDESRAVEGLRAQLRDGVSKAQLKTTGLREQSVPRLIGKARFMETGDDPEDVGILVGTDLEARGAMNWTVIDALDRIMSARREAHQPHALADVTKTLGLKISDVNRAEYYRKK